ncbi:MAG: BON domain-containing protein [Candidatus Korobacteraceae bacterium]
MTRGHSAAIAVMLGMVSPIAAGAQTAQPPAANSTLTTGAAPASDQSVSPEVQAKLVQGIRRAILMQPYYTVFDNLGYTLEGRTVTLTGQVLNPTLPKDVQSAVKKVEGVDKVVNKIEVLPPSPMDAEIREQVRQKIYGGFGPLFKYANMPNPPIRIIVKNARVTLYGVVDNETDKNLCTQRVNQIFSVLSVTNNLAVVPPTSNNNTKSNDTSSSKKK